MTKDLVSIIIPTHKRRGQSDSFDRCLISVAHSTYKNVQIIGVDEGLERSAQRNIGLKAAQGEYILYLDDDQYVSPDLVKECIELIKHCSAIFIPEIIVTNNWFGRLRNWERKFYIGTPVDCIRFFKAENCPLFDEDLIGPEDADFDRRVKGNRLIANNVLYHNDNIGMFEYLKKKAYYARSMKKYKQRWPNDKVLSLRYRCFGVFIEHGKWRRLLAKPHLAIALMVLIFLRGVIYLWQK